MRFFVGTKTLDARRGRDVSSFDQDSDGNASTGAEQVRFERSVLSLNGEH